MKRATQRVVGGVYGRALALGLIWFLPTYIVAGCAGRITIEGTEIVPAATAEISLTEDENRNTRVDLVVKYLAPPHRLGPNFHHYVIWVSPADREDFIRQGAMTISKKRRGRLGFITPHSQFQLLITAEESPHVSKPSQRVAFEAMLDAGRQ